MHVAFEDWDMHCFRIFFLNFPFLSQLYELDLSFKDRNLGQIRFIAKSSSIYPKSVCATSTRPFGEVGGNSPLQLLSRTLFAKIEDKKVSAKN